MYTSLSSSSIKVQPIERAIRTGLVKTGVKSRKYDPEVREWVYDPSMLCDMIVPQESGSFSGVELTLLTQQ